MTQPTTAAAAEIQRRKELYQANTPQLAAMARVTAGKQRSPHQNFAQSLHDG